VLLFLIYFFAQYTEWLAASLPPSPFDSDSSMQASVRSTSGSVSPRACPPPASIADP
jgi:hypothetical protein